MTTQYIIVAAIVSLTIYYIARRIIQTFREAQSGCYGCKGCALKEQIIRQRAKNSRKAPNMKENECFHKK